LLLTTFLPAPLSLARRGEVEVLLGVEERREVEEGDILEREGEVEEGKEKFGEVNLGVLLREEEGVWCREEGLGVGMLSPMPRLGDPSIALGSMLFNRCSANLGSEKRRIGGPLEVGVGLE
jgi:hypothetical protein